MNTSRFDYLLKNYLRNSSYSSQEVAGFLNSSIKTYISYPLKLPDVDFVIKVIQKLKIPPTMVWTAYFNSLYAFFYQKSNVFLVPYQEYEEMIKSNSKKRKKGSIPWEEVHLKLFNDDKYSLNGLSLKFYVEATFHRQGLPKKEKLKALSKEFNVPQSLIKEITSGKIISIKQLEILVHNQPESHQSLLISCYINTIIQKKKLNYMILNEFGNELLLDQFYSK